MYNIIGLSGKAGSGKDYIAQQILRPLGYYQFSFAWHFKVGIVGEGHATHKEVFVTKPDHVRRALQLKGTELGRDVYGEDVWCNHVFEWFNVLHENWGINKFVIPDVRFKNEVKFIRDHGGIVIRIIAPTRVSNSSLSAEARQHISEIDLDDVPLDFFDGVIYNDPGQDVAQQLLSLSIY